MAKIVDASDPHAAWATMSLKTALNIFLYGLFVGVLTFVLYILLERFVFDPLLCAESVESDRCQNSGSYAGGIAIFLGATMGLVLLVKERVYRPILAIIGVVFGLWTIFGIVQTLPVTIAGIVIGILFGLAYVLYSWLVQPTSLLVSVLGIIVVTVLARIALA